MVIIRTTTPENDALAQGQKQEHYNINILYYYVQVLGRYLVLVYVLVPKSTMNLAETE